MRYAKALFAYTEHTGTSEEVFGEMMALERNFAIEPRLRLFLLNPILRQRDKVALLKSAVSERVTRPTWRLIRLVVRNHREEMMQAIALNYLHFYRKARNINRVEIGTVVPLSSETQERLKLLVQTKTHGTVELIRRINPDLIGGFVFEMDYQRIDASVSSQLKEIQKNLKL
jgi:F-type H+-transporting ATPase subunit delta